MRNYKIFLPILAMIIAMACTPSKCDHIWQKGHCVECGTDCEHDTWVDGVCPECNFACPHEWDNSVCTICGKSCEHKWEEGVCTICKKACQHEWKDGVCTICKKACQHEWSDGVCTICKKACQHEWKDGVCTICKKACQHEWSDGVCAICGKACQHKWENSVCTICGKACEHKWENGTCTICKKVCNHEWVGGICAECQTTILVQNPWCIKSFCGIPVNPDVYIKFSTNNQFTIIQRSGAMGYVTYKGSYVVGMSNSTVSGEYSDGETWACDYYFSRSQDGELIMTNVNSSSDVYVYEPSEMPKITSSQPALLNTEPKVKRPL